MYFIPVRTSGSLRYKNSNIQMGMLNGADISVAKYIRESIIPSFIGNSKFHHATGLCSG